MEIQQEEKESLAAYVHWFKTEAKRCNFMKDVATIRIFIKGLRNAHTLDTHIYERGPQVLSNAISKVEKLNAVQQLTTTITPPSTVNMVTNNEDRCFQCQEQGHIARNCPNIRCFECDEYGHIIMDWPHKIPPSGTPAMHHQLRPHKKSLCQIKFQIPLWGQVSATFYRHCSSSHQNSYRGHSRS